jgi:hypothetical protein
VRIGGNLPQLHQIFPPLVRVAFLQPLLVGNGLRLDELDGHGTALQIVQVKEALVRSFIDRLAEFSRSSCRRDARADAR